jgi:hypothetical protein
MPADHHTLLAAAARTYVNAGAITAIHAGKTWQDTAWPSMSAGGAGGGLSYWTDRRGVTFGEHFRRDVLGTVTWAELADVVRRGVTDHIATELSAAYASYCHRADSEIGLTIGPRDHQGWQRDISTMHRLEQLVVTRGLDATPDQLDLFQIGA